MRDWGSSIRLASNIGYGVATIMKLTGMADNASRRTFRSAQLLSLAALVLLTACGSWAPNAESERRRREAYEAERAKSIFGEGGLTFGGSRESAADQGGGGIGVNSFLWRASLDTVADLPVASADPFGGVILTDWHAPDGAASERFKINVFILGRQLRADGLTVSVFRQLRDETGQWLDAPVAEGTARAIEDTILTRARELRVVSAQLQQ